MRATCGWAVAWIALVAGLATASDDAANISHQIVPLERIEAAQSAPTEQPEISQSAPAQDATGDSASPEQSSPLLDKRDRIFYPGDTERAKPLARKLLLNILLDQEQIFTSPFRMNRHNAPRTATTTAHCGLIREQQRTSPLGRTNFKHRRIVHAHPDRRRLLRIWSVER